MKRIILFMPSILSFSAAANAQAVYVQAPPPPLVVQQPICRPYSDTLKIGPEKRVTRGTACLQPDGSWALRPETATVNYLARGGALYAVPTQPFVGVIVDDKHHRRNAAHARPMAR